MDIVHHAAIGGIGALALASRDLEVAALAFVAASVLPDLDIAFMVGGKRAYLRNHQGPTHSLVASPLLAAAVKSKKLVLAGGIAKKPVQDWLEASLGAAAHWTDTSGTGTRSVAGLELAIQRGGVAAVVLLEGSISHAESERVIAACKKAKVPLARGKRGGRQSLKDALTALEKAVAKTAN